MAIGMRVGNSYWEIGDSNFIHSFFSTISYHLETDGWGTRFPVLLNELYQGSLRAQNSGSALEELGKVKRELSRFPPSQVVWDIENLEARPPWGDNISPDITDLSTYFVTSDGRDLFEVIEAAISYLQHARNETLRIQ